MEGGSDAKLQASRSGEPDSRDMTQETCIETLRNHPSGAEAPGMRSPSPRNRTVLPRGKLMQTPTSLKDAWQRGFEVSDVDWSLYPPSTVAAFGATLLSTCSTRFRAVLAKLTSRKLTVTPARLRKGLCVVGKHLGRPSDRIIVI